MAASFKGQERRPRARDKGAKGDPRGNLSTPRREINGIKVPTRADCYRIERVVEPRVPGQAEEWERMGLVSRGERVDLFSIEHLEPSWAAIKKRWGAGCYAFRWYADKGSHQLGSKSERKEFFDTEASPLPRQPALIDLDDTAPSVAARPAEPERAAGPTGPDPLEAALRAQAGEGGNVPVSMALMFLEMGRRAAADQRREEDERRRRYEREDREREVTRREEEERREDRRRRDDEDRQKRLDREHEQELARVKTRAENEMKAQGAFWKEQAALASRMTGGGDEDLVDEIRAMREANEKGQQENKDMWAKVLEIGGPIVQGMFTKPALPAKG